MPTLDKVSEQFQAVLSHRNVPVRLLGVDVPHDVLFARDGYLAIWLLQIDYLAREIFKAGTKTQLAPDQRGHFNVRVEKAGNVPTAMKLLMFDYTLDELQAGKAFIPIDALVNTWAPRINAVLERAPRLR